MAKSKKLSPFARFSKQQIIIALVFILGFGGFGVYKLAFSSASPASIYHSCGGRDHYINGPGYSLGAYQKYSIAFVNMSYVKGQANPAYVAAEGTAGRYGSFSSKVYVAPNQAGWYFVSALDFTGRYKIVKQLAGYECAAG